MMVDPDSDFDQETMRISLEGKRVVFIGKLGGVNRREAFRLMRRLGGVPAEQLDERTDLVVIGADETPVPDRSFIDQRVKSAVGDRPVEIITEDDLWNRLGLVDNQGPVQRLYTPAMLAEFVGVPVSVIRRWHRRGLIVPTREIHKLPYFDFEEVATARRLAELLNGGASPWMIERKLQQLSKLLPEFERPLAQASVVVDGCHLLLRQGESLIEPDGQKRFDFGSEDAAGTDVANENETGKPSLDRMAIRGVFSSDPPPMRSQEMTQLAMELEEAGEIDDAIEMYRAALISGGIDAEICFRLAELLYRQGDLTAARERYSAAIEIDEEFVEARSNLGCLLTELGETELAIAAFQGAIRHHPEYPDVHYHLARLLDDLGDIEAANEHWQQFIALAPDSPWAEEARQRLRIDSVESES